MTWEEYYEKFYDWPQSAQLKRIDALTGFVAVSEIIEIAENLDETAASRLIQKTCAQGVGFNARAVMALCEYVDKKTIVQLLKRCKEKFTAKQIAYFIDNTMLWEDEILALLQYEPPYLLEEPFGWAEFYDAFYHLSPAQQVLVAQKIKDFGDQEEVVEIAMALPEGESQYQFIKNARSKNISFSAEQAMFLAQGNERMQALLGCEKHAFPKRAN